MGDLSLKETCQLLFIFSMRKPCSVSEGSLWPKIEIQFPFFSYISVLTIVHIFDASFFSFLMVSRIFSQLLFPQFYMKFIGYFVSQSVLYMCVLVLYLGSYSAAFTRMFSASSSTSCRKFFRT